MNALVLKIIALVTMIIDHTGAVLFPQYFTLRLIGRIAFPIYIFLIAQGCRHTRSMEKYMLRLFVFALISEIPFDLMGWPPAWFDWSGQNVFFTLFLGVLACYCTRWLKGKRVPDYLAWLPLLPILALSYWMHTDYKVFGVLAIFLTAQFRSKYMQVLMVAVFIVLQYLLNSGSVEMTLWAAVALVPLALYNGKPGPKRFKMAFYAAYPVHLAILAVLRFTVFR